ncbi:MAG: flavodoxin family protein [Anaerofustis sp.]
MNALIMNCSPVRTGATAEITKIISSDLIPFYNAKSICIDDYKFDFCKGCRSCHDTAKCVIQNDDIRYIMAEFEWADVIISVSPSYWADVPGQYKAFIDRCTPWCNTHDPHAVIGQGKRGYSVALRTGASMRECNRIIESIEHFYGHLEISPCGNLGLCSVESVADVRSRADEIKAFCNLIKGDFTESKSELVSE